MTAFTGQAADRRAATLIPDTSLLALPLDGQVRRADDEDPFDETAEPQIADQRAGQDLSLLDDGLGSQRILRGFRHSRMVLPSLSVVRVQYGRRRAGYLRTCTAL